MIFFYIRFYVECFKNELRFEKLFGQTHYLFRLVVS